MLDTKWIQLLKLVYLRKRITIADQYIYKSNSFYKITEELIKIGWMKRDETTENNFKKYYYSLTVEGRLVVKFAFNQIKGS